MGGYNAKVHDNQSIWVLDKMLLSEEAAGLQIEVDLKHRKRQEAAPSKRSDEVVLIKWILNDKCTHKQKMRKGM